MLSSASTGHEVELQRMGQCGWHMDRGSPMPVPFGSLIAAARTLLINDRVKALVFAMEPGTFALGLPTPYLTSIRVHADRTGESGSRYCARPLP